MKNLVLCSASSDMSDLAIEWALSFVLLLIFLAFVVSILHRMDR